MQQRYYVSSYIPCSLLYLCLSSQDSPDLECLHSLCLSGFKSHLGSQAFPALSPLIIYTTY